MITKINTPKYGQIWKPKNWGDSEVIIKGVHLFRTRLIPMNSFDSIFEYCLQVDSNIKSINFAELTLDIKLISFLPGVRGNAGTFRIN